MYVAIIGDIIDSKSIVNRYELQEKLSSILDKINKEYEEDIGSKFTITLGDEFQGLLTTPIHVLEIIDKIRYTMKEISIRFGIGVGEIETKINVEQSLGADGPAYWNAREAIKIVHKANDFKRSHTCIVTNKESKQDDLYVATLNLCAYIESRWTSSQKALMAQIVLMYGYQVHIKQNKVASVLDIGYSDMNKRLKKMGYKNYVSAKFALCNSLMEQWEA